MGSRGFDVQSAVRVLQLAATVVDNREDAAACHDFADFIDECVGGGRFSAPGIGEGVTAREFVTAILDSLATLKKPAANNLKKAQTLIDSVAPKRKGKQKTTPKRRP